MAAYGAPEGGTNVAVYDAGESLRIYPNPVSDYFTIDVDGRADLTLYNNIGQVVIARIIEGRTVIDVSTMNKGLYIVQVKDEGGNVSSAKLILQ